MNRTILAIAATFLAATTVFTGAAEACISCQHVPVVVRNSSASYSATPSFHIKKRFYRAANKRRPCPAKRRIVKRETFTKKLRTSKTAPIEKSTNPENENSTISTTSLDTDEAGKTEAKPKAVPNPKPKPNVNKNVGCKKFFPSVGMTLTVPCE